MKIYVAYCHDRHEDPDITAHATQEEALDYAEEYLREQVAHPLELTSWEDVGDGRWEMRYNVERDHAIVQECEL